MEHPINNLEAPISHKYKFRSRERLVKKQVNVNHMAPLQPQQRTAAIAMLESGWAIRAVARNLGVSHTAIQKLKHKWDTEHTVERRLDSGRPKVTQPNQDEDICQYAREHCFTTIKSAVEATNFPGSLLTARRRLLEQGLRGYSAPVKDVLYPRHKRDRVEFAEAHLQLPENFWQNVIFSDEKVSSPHRTLKRSRRPIPINCIVNKWYTHVASDSLGD
ncbi:hypothetical protein NQ315_000014 [Exocentrus adspersus]|uniref:Transposase Tc1-like domain-containing protein n=1 Tax=Exocentrus adspersus TaxID=1586481 RepID=A0AAV8VFH9_9CUCU|nr:hypothetical protein NQ315_000014 [Exocentrus adspersus]